MSLFKASVFRSVTSLTVQYDGHGCEMDYLSIDQLLHNIKFAVDAIRIGTVGFRTVDFLSLLHLSSSILQH